MQNFLRDFKLVFSCALCLALISCAAKPAFYKNEKYSFTSEEARNNDIKYCKAEADEMLKNSKTKQVVKGATTGAVVGAIGGAAIGLITGNTSQALALGAAVGAGAGGASGGASAAISPNHLKQNYATRCLSNKGYDVIGWQ